MNRSQGEDVTIACALVCSRTGVVLGGYDKSRSEPNAARLEEVAAAAPELLDAGAATDFTSLLAELSHPERNGDVRELVMISASRRAGMLRTIAHCTSSGRLVFIPCT